MSERAANPVNFRSPDGIYPVNTPANGIVVVSAECINVLQSLR